MISKKITAFAGSNSSRSINKQLIHYTAENLTGAQVNILDLNDFEMPIYSYDREAKSGVPEEAFEFMRIMKESDGIIISLAEHNGNITVALKNILDWASRADMDIFAGKPVLLLGTSIGRAGARSAMEIGVKLMKRFNGELVDQFSLPSFNHTFANGAITDSELRSELFQAIKAFEKVVSGREVEIL